MRGKHLFSDKSSSQGALKGAVGTADIKDVSYDPIINMNFVEYENNLQNHAQAAESVHSTLSKVVMGMILTGALSNAWNPVGWVLGAVAGVLELAISLGVFKEKSSWDSDRARRAWTVVSRFYERNVYGEKTGRKNEKGEDIYTGGLAQIISSTSAQDELVQGIMNHTYFGLCVYEAVFKIIKETNWKSEESKSHTNDLYNMVQKLKNNFYGKIKSYGLVYQIAEDSIPITLSEGVFDAFYKELNLAGDPIDWLDRERIVFSMPTFGLNRKNDAIGMGVTFTDFRDASLPKAQTFENYYKDEVGRKELFDIGKKNIEILKLDNLLSSDEAEYYAYMNWLNSASAFEKGMTFNGGALNTYLKREGEQGYNTQCKSLTGMIEDFLFKRKNYENATKGDVILAAKEIKKMYDSIKDSNPKQGYCYQQLNRKSQNSYIKRAFEKFGLDINDFDENFNLVAKKPTSPTSDILSGNQSGSNLKEYGLEIPKGYTDERPKGPTPKVEPTHPAPSPDRGNITQTVPTAPVVTPPESQRTDLVATPTGESPQKKRKSWWWILLLAGSGFCIYQINKQNKKKNE